MKRTILFLALGLFAFSAQSRKATQEPKKTTQKPLLSDVHVLMYNVLSELTELQRWVSSEKKFKDPKNAPEISQHLDALSELSGKVIRTKDLQSPTFRISGEALYQHILTTRSVFKNGNKDYARWMLQATPMACASCHTQLPDSPKPLWGLRKEDVAGNPFEKAEFLFGTRNYDPALELYSQVISQYPGNTLPKGSLESLDVETALKRKLVIFVRSERNLPAAIESFKKDLKNPGLPEHVQKYLKSWIAQLEKASHKKTPDPKTASEKEVLKFAQKNIDPKKSKAFVSSDNPQLVDQLLASAVLYGYLESHPRSAATPDLLYWLAMTDYAVNNEFFFSLGNMYLIECIRSYPNSEMAKKCYKEYADEIEFLYTGTSGTHIPPEAKQALKNLKMLIDSGKRPIR